MPRSSDHGRVLPDSVRPTTLLDDIGGYRVVRALSTGRYADRLLVHAEGVAWVARLFRLDCPDAVIDHELAVSDAVRSASDELIARVSVVHELCTTDDGRIALFEQYLGGPRLDVLVRSRPSQLALGEAVTLLAPLAHAVDEGHRIGLTGLLPEASAVRLQMTGAPVLTRRSAARLGPALPERFRDREPRYAADRVALERVGAAIATGLDHDERTALLAALSRPRGALDHALFDLAAPLPVRWETERVAPASEGTRHGASAAMGSTAALSSLDTDAESAGGVDVAQRVRTAVSATLDTLGVPASITSTASAAAAEATRRTSALVSRVRGRRATGGGLVRPRFAIIGLAGVLALIVAVSLGVQAAAPGSGAAAGGDASSPGPGERPEATSDSEGAPGSTVAGPPEIELHPEPEAWRAIVDELVDRWITCAREGAERVVALEQCASAVVHEGSAAAVLIAANDDRHTVLSDWRRAGGGVLVVERMGAAVLVDLLTGTTATASLLMVRSEAGWRIRDVIA